VKLLIRKDLHGRLFNPLADRRVPLSSELSSALRDLSFAKTMKQRIKVLSQLKAAFADDFNAAFAELTQAKPKALVLYSTKEGSFMVGADINLFENAESAQEVSELSVLCQQTFQKLADLDIPVVAANSDTVLGLPEVMLGLKHRMLKYGPGFYTTRILAPYLNEATRLLTEGVDVGTKVGPVLEKAFGMQIGKEYGGNSMSTQAKSCIMAEVSSHSGLISSMVVIPNSLDAGL